MKITFRGKCHTCRVPLDPRITVESQFEIQQVLTWSALTDVNLVPNDCIYKFISPYKVVRMCQDCYTFKPKISLRELGSRETTGSKLDIDVPSRKSWTGGEMLKWYKGIQTCPMIWEEIPESLRVYPYYGFIIKFRPL
jgi:hypothetical protein